ncbi:MAG TPA: sugar phosphate isomerase/epimerase family protein, partial [Planctomycetota bacterium]|nr:sugar phosphate isomerase/epimerase family protein [Planctomycetota bacterium]
ARGVAAQGAAGGSAEPLFRISLAQWSLHRALQSGALDTFGFVRDAREAYGLEAVEYVCGFFRDKAADFGWLGELRQRCDDQGVRSLLIMVDGEGALGASDADERRRAVERHFRWIAASAFLGGHAIRVNAEGDGDRAEHSKHCAESLRRLGDLGADYGVSVIVENHGGPSSDGAWLAATIRRADHPFVGTLPDFGNFRIDAETTYDRYRGIAELMPFARAVSAKSHDFDAAGNEVHTDYRRMLKIVLDAGYRGFVGVEWEGSSLPEPDGIRATLRLLERVRAELTGEYRR